jgi:O-antigen/teichoic acid export membrane protein
VSEAAGEREEGSGLAGGSALAFLATVAGNAGYFVAVLLLARGLGASARGSIAFMTVCALVTGRVVTFGLSNATSVLAAQRGEARPRLLANALAFSACSGVGGAALVCLGLLALGSHRPGGIDAAGFAAIAAGILAVAVQEETLAFLQGCNRFVERSASQIAGPWFYAVLLAVLWLAGGLDTDRAVLAWAAGQAFLAVALVVASVRVSGLGRPDAPLLREAIRFGLLTWLGSLARFLNFRLDQLLMGFLVTEATLGVYAVAVNASEVLLYLPSAIGLVLIPVLARRSPGEQRRTTLLACRITLLLVGSTTLVALALGPPLLPVVFGERYQDAVVPFVWLALGAIGFGFMSIFASALMTAGRPGLSQVGPVVALVAGLALDLALIPWLGATGAAVAATAAFFAGGLSGLWSYRRAMPFALRELVPHRGDVRALWSAARQRLRPRPASAATS